MLIRPSAIAALLMSLGWVPAAMAQAQPAVAVRANNPPPAADFPAPPAEQPSAAPSAAPPPAAPPAAPAPASAAAPAPPAEPVAMAPAPVQRDEPSTDKEAATPQKRNKKRRFYAGVHLGGGYFHASSGSSDDPRRFGGGTVSGMVALGGRIGSPGNWTIAGAFMRDQVYGLTSHDSVIDGDEPHLNDVTFGLWALAFLVDYAPDPNDGLHFQGWVGGGKLAVSRPGRSADDPSGFMAGLGVGYDFRLSPTVTVGGLLRATYAPLESTEVSGNSGRIVKILVPALLLTASIH